jgi:hypothetical protein
MDLSSFKAYSSRDMIVLVVGISVIAVLAGANKQQPYPIRKDSKTMHSNFAKWS